MGQKLLKQAVGQRRQPLQHITQVSPWVVPVQARRLHQAHHDGRALAGEFAAQELHARRPIAQGLIWRSRWLLSMATAR